MWYGVVTAEHAYLRSEPENDKKENKSGIEDEILSGWAVKVPEDDVASSKEKDAESYVKVETHYGYQGYVKRGELRAVTEEELNSRQNPEKFFRIGIAEADLLDQPKVQGLPLELLQKNSVVELLEREAAEGWSLVRTAAGREGYIHTQNLRKREDTDGYLTAKTEEERSAYFRDWKAQVLRGKSRETSRFDEKAWEWYFDFGASETEAEEILRERLTKSAKEFLGTQYRWGGKSSQGIDCSGLMFMSYLAQGILIYRDAQIVEGYPVKKIEKEQLKKGDLIFFPGHVAMYLGDGKYIHSTGFIKTPYVTVNSLREEDPDYRADLGEKITEYGSIFV